MKRRSSKIITVLLLCSITVQIYCTGSKKQLHTSNPQRIISFAPSITETIFALQLGNRLVGVTDYCSHPSKAKDLPSIGGYTNPNYEMILRLKPDVVLLLKEHNTLISFLRSNSIKFVTIDNQDILGIAESFRIIGTVCNEKNRGDSLANQLLQRIKTEVVSLKKPRLLLIVGRDNVGSKSISKVFVAGPKTFYSEIIERAGAKNAYTGSLSSYPALSIEAILRINPDIIIDLAATYSNIVPQTGVADWNGLKTVNAVKYKQVYCPIGDYLTIPGPRIDSTFLLIKEIVSIVQPDSETN